MRSVKSHDSIFFVERNSYLDFEFPKLLLKFVAIFKVSTEKPDLPRDGLLATTATEFCVREF